MQPAASDQQTPTPYPGDGEGPQPERAPKLVGEHELATVLEQCVVARVHSTVQ